jgi:GNAT superfamily N-acetyltransferase
VYYQSLPQMGKFAAKVDQTSLRAEPEGQGDHPGMNYSLKILAAAGKATLKWRAVTAADLAAIQRLADTEHVSLPERPEVFAEKFELFRDGCLVLVQEGTIVGYCFSHPWLLRDIPPLDTLLRHLPPSPECLFIHDLAIEPRVRGKGATGILVEFLVSLARREGLSHLALVSVYGTYPLWTRFGFEVVSDAALADHLKSYGDTARYMVRAAAESAL